MNPTQQPEDGAYPIHVSSVSVIVTTKDNEATIGRCLESIKNQDIDRLELIVVDNGSADATVAIAKEYTSQVFAKGPSRNVQRNFGVAQARGDGVLILDADMVLAPTVLSECVALASSQYEAIVIPESSSGAGYWGRVRALERSFDTSAQPRFFTRALYGALGGYDETLAGEDQTMLARTLSQTSVGRITGSVTCDEGSLTFRQALASTPRISLGELMAAYKLYVSKAGALFTVPGIGLGLIGLKLAQSVNGKFHK